MDICGDQAVFIPPTECDDCAGLKQDIQDLRRNKQDKLVEGDNIIIEGNRISSTGESYQAGTGISIGAGNTINAERNPTNTYTKQEVNTLIGDLEHVRMTEVTTLPSTGVSNMIYLVPKPGGGHNMYVWDDINKVFVPVGEDTIDLTDYVKNTDINSASKDGIVTKGTGQVNKAWRTDASGNPAWRDMVIPVNPSPEPTENGAIWFTTT